MVFVFPQPPWAVIPWGGGTPSGSELYLWTWSTPPKKHFAPYGNWGGCDKTEVCGNTTRNFLGPGAAGSGRTELRNHKFAWILTFLEGCFMTKCFQIDPQISPKARGFWLKEPSAKIHFGKWPPLVFWEMKKISKHRNVSWKWVPFLCLFMVLFPSLKMWF